MITIGADPEFASLNCVQGKYRAGEIGLDGAGAPTFELRPAPGTAREVTENIRLLLEKATASRHPVAGFAGPFALGRPLGGHVHLGHRAFLEDRQLCCSVADILGALVAPIVFQIDPTGSAQRYSRGYGRASDWREQPHGMEWRAPFSWLWDPQLTEDVLWLTGLIAETVVEQMCEIRFDCPSVCDSLNSALKHGLIGEIDDLADAAILRIGDLIEKVSGSDLADRAVEVAERIRDFDRPSWSANIFARWKIGPTVMINAWPIWDDTGWIYELGSKICERTGAYQLIVYGIASYRANARLSCAGLRQEIGEWSIAGYGAYAVVPKGVLAIGIPASLRACSSGAEAVREAMEQLAEIDQSLVFWSDDQYYSETGRELERREEEMAEEEFEDEDEYEEEPDDWDEPDEEDPDDLLVSGTTLLIPPRGYWTL